MSNDITLFLIFQSLFPFQCSVIFFLGIYANLTVLFKCQNKTSKLQQIKHSVNAMIMHSEAAATYYANNSHALSARRAALEQLKVKS